LDEPIIEIGYISHFFSKINVGIIELTLPISVGDHILVKGLLTDFDQKVESMQIDRREIHMAEGGQSVGLKLTQLAREKDVVYKRL
jgi:putative protease